MNGRVGLWLAGLGAAPRPTLGGPPGRAGRRPARRPGDPLFSSRAHQARGRAWILCSAGLGPSVPRAVLCPRCK